MVLNGEKASLTPLDHWKKAVDYIGEAIRKDTDWVTRYGEIELLIALPETGVQEALIVARRLRLRISFITIEGGSRFQDTRLSFWLRLQR